MGKKQTLRVQPPLEYTGLRVVKAKDHAAGMPSIVTAVKHVMGAMDVGRATKALFNLNQVGGIDCPGCAWPDPDDERSAIGEYCENGAKAIAEEATLKKITPRFFQQHTVSELSQWSDFELGQKGRIDQPMVLQKGHGHYAPISWKAAFSLIAEHLNSLNSPNEAIFYTSGRTSNEAAFLYQLFVRQFGTNNLPDCSNMCHESSGVALSETLGVGKGSVKLEDFEKAEVIIIAGQNPGTNHPRMLSALEKAKKKGATIITVNPLPEAGLIRFKNPQKFSGIMGAGTMLTDLFLQAKVNGDLALFKAIMKILAEKESQNPGTVFDHDFIKAHTDGFEQFSASLAQADLGQLAGECGVPIEQIEAAAGILAKSDKIIVCWAMGLTQHKNGVATIKEIVNLLLLKGSIGKPGAGTCPVRGHSNVQGDRTMGIWEKPKKAFLDRLGEEFAFAPPYAHGYDTVNAIRAMAGGKAKVFIAMGGNFLSATPDTEFTGKALQRCKLTVHVSTKLNRSHLVHGETALVLPCLGRTDIDRQATGPQFVTVENSMGVVHQSTGKLKPVSAHLLSEPAIVAGMAKAVLGKQSSVDWDGLVADYDRIRDKIEAVVPGFENYNSRVRQKGGFYLPNGPRENRYETETGKARFSINNSSMVPLGTSEFLMMTIRSHDQFNTTIYGLNDRYRGIFNGRRVVFMNREDMEAAGFADGVLVDLYNRTGGQERVAEKFKVVGYDIPPRCVATYFPEANVLVPLESTADQSNTPTSKSVVVKIEKAL